MTYEQIVDQGKESVDSWIRAHAEGLLRSGESEKQIILEDLHKTIRPWIAKAVEENAQRVRNLTLKEVSESIECFADEICDLTSMKCSNHRAIEDLRV